MSLKELKPETSLNTSMAETSPTRGEGAACQDSSVAASEEGRAQRRITVRRADGEMWRTEDRLLGVARGPESF